MFDSSTGFLLPDGSVRSPDASVLQLERWHSLSPAQREGFPPLCPDLVVELASPSDMLPELRRKMATYITNGARPNARAQDHATRFDRQRRTTAAGSAARS